MVKNIQKETKDMQENKVVRTRGRKDLSNINPEYTDAFIQEVDDEVKNDNFKELWKKYGVLIVAIVVIAVSAAVSFDRIRAWKIARNQHNTENYIAATQVQPDLDNTLAALQKIVDKNQGIFSDFSRLQIANILLDQGKTEEALQQLFNIANDKQVNSEIKNIALIKYATYKVDTMPQNEFAAMIKPLAYESNSWAPLAQELMAMSAIANGDIDKARDIYNAILKIKDLPENFKNKVQDMLSSLNEVE